MSTTKILAERYEVGELLGYGGMAEVRLARDTRLGRDVAVKILRSDLARDQTFQARFRREGQSAAALNNQAIVAVYDTGTDPSTTPPTPFIVMEYVEGQTLRDLLRSGSYVPVGLLDDAPKLRGARVHGVPVLGRIDQVEEIARETAARLLVIAIPSLDADEMQRIIALCESTQLPFRMVPRLQDLLSGRSLPGELKEVAIEDLLGRETVPPDWQSIRNWLGARAVLVTGAGGSILFWMPSRPASSRAAKAM